MNIMNAAPSPAVTGGAAIKSQKPALAGHRIKQRKGQKYTAADPEGFRNNLCDILEESAGDMEKAQKLIDATDQLDFHRYATVFFECVMYGGIVGMPSEDDWEESLFERNDAGAVTEFVDFIEKLCRRRPYLKPSFTTTVTKLFLHLLTDTDTTRAEKNDMMKKKCADMAGLLVARQIVPASAFNAVINDRLVEPGISVKFLCDAFNSFLSENSVHELQVMLKQNGVDERMLEFLPRYQRNPAAFGQAFAASGLEEVVKPYKMRMHDEMTSEIHNGLQEIINDSLPVNDAIDYINHQKKERNMSEKDVFSVCWDAIFDGVEGNPAVKPDPAMKQLKTYAPLLGFFVKSNRTQAELVRVIQNFCVDATWKPYFMKFVKCLYDTDVVAEETILAWNKMEQKHNPSSEFLVSMAPFIKWLEEAESDEED